MEKKEFNKNNYIQDLNKEWFGKSSIKNKKIYIYKEQGLEIIFNFLDIYY